MNQDWVPRWHRSSGRVISSCEPCSARWHSRWKGDRSHIWLGKLFWWALSTESFEGHQIDTFTHSKPGYVIVTWERYKWLRMKSGHHLQQIYLPSYHLLGYHMNIDNTSLIKSENFVRRSAKILSAPTHLKQTHHPHLNATGGTTIASNFYFACVYQCMP